MNTCDPENWWCHTTGNLVLDTCLALIMLMLWTLITKKDKR